MPRSRRSRWAEGVSALILLAVASWIWAPVASGLLVREAHSCIHEGRHGRAETFLRAASWLQPGNEKVSRSPASCEAAPAPAGRD